MSSEDGDAETQGPLSLGGLFWENMEVLSMVDSNEAKIKNLMGSWKLGHPQDHDLKTITLTLFCSNSPLAHVMNIHPSILRNHHFGSSQAPDS